MGKVVRPAQIPQLPVPILPATPVAMEPSFLYKDVKVLHTLSIGPVGQKVPFTTVTLLTPLSLRLIL